MWRWATRFGNDGLLVLGLIHKNFIDSVLPPLALFQIATIANKLDQAPAMKKINSVYLHCQLDFKQ